MENLISIIIIGLLLGGLVVGCWGYENAKERYDWS